MKRALASLIVLLMAMSAGLLAAESSEAKPKLTVIYYYLPG